MNRCQLRRIPAGDGRPCSERVRLATSCTPGSQGCTMSCMRTGRRSDTPGSPRWPRCP
jgi:hypothetical protein